MTVVYRNGSPKLTEFGNGLQRFKNQQKPRIWTSISRKILDFNIVPFFSEWRDIFRHVWGWIQSRDPKASSGRNGHVRRFTTFTANSDATYGHWFHEKASVRRSGTGPTFDSDIFPIPSIIARSPITSWD